MLRLLVVALLFLDPAGASAETGAISGRVIDTSQSAVPGAVVQLRPLDSAAFTGRSHNVYTRVAYTALPTAKFTGVRYSSVAGASAVSVTGNRLPYAPEHLLSWTVGYQNLSGLDLQAELVHVRDQYGDDLNSTSPSADGQRGLLPAYTIWNVVASYAIPRWRSALFVAIKNAGDTIYVADRSRGLLPGPPRLVQAGLRARF